MEIENDYIENDCCMQIDNNWFRYRAAAIIVENGCVLFAKNSSVNHYYSIGGGVHLNEKAEDAVKREVIEETGVEYEIDRLAIINETFFSGVGGRLDGLNCHMITLYFLMKPRGTQELNSNSYEHGRREEMHWLPIEDLDKYKTYPQFMKEYLTNIDKYGNQIVHFIDDQRKK